MGRFYRGRLGRLLDHIADEGKQQAEENGGAQRDIDVAASELEIEIAGELAKTEAAQQRGEPAQQEQGEDGDEKPAHGCSNAAKIIFQAGDVIFAEIAA
jgi:hypothetical protein